MIHLWNFWLMRRQRRHYYIYMYIIKRKNISLCILILESGISYYWKSILFGTRSTIIYFRNESMRQGPKWFFKINSYHTVIFKLKKKDCNTFISILLLHLVKKNSKKRIIKKKIIKISKHRYWFQILFVLNFSNKYCKLFFTLWSIHWPINYSKWKIYIWQFIYRVIEFNAWDDLKFIAKKKAYIFHLFATIIY